MKNYKKIILLCVVALGQTVSLSAGFLDTIGKATGIYLNPSDWPNFFTPGPLEQGPLRQGEVAPERDVHMIGPDLSGFLGGETMRSLNPALATKDVMAAGGKTAESFVKVLDVIAENRIKQFDGIVSKYARSTTKAITVGVLVYFAYKYVVSKQAQNLHKVPLLKDIVLVKKPWFKKVVPSESLDILGVSGVAQVLELKALLIAKKTGVFGISNVLGRNKALIQALAIDCDIACIPGRFVAGGFADAQSYETLTGILRWLSARRIPLVILGAENMAHDKAFFEWLSISFPRNMIILSFSGSDSVCSQDTGRSFDLNVAVEG